MSVFLDTTTGMGLAGATGVRPYLPPLLAGGLARGDIGIDFDGTDWRFLESTGFLLAVLAVAVAAYLLERTENARAVEIVSGVAGITLGALLFAGALADGAALLLAAIAVFVPPVSILAIGAFVVLLFRGRRREGEKYAGLRVLR